MKISPDTLIPLGMAISLLAGAAFVGASAKSIATSEASISEIRSQLVIMNERLSKIEGYMAVKTKHHP